MAIGPAHLRLIWQRVVPNPEPVTYYSRTPTDIYTQYALLHSKRKKLDKKEADVNIVTVESSTQAWQFWVYWLEQAGIVAPLVPRIGDYFVDGQGNGWNITKANFAAMSERWDVSCTNRDGTTLAITTTKLPAGTVSVPYSQAIAVANAAGLYDFELYGGVLPTGLSLNGTTGVISGTPSTTTGSPFSFSVGVMDNSGVTVVVPYSVVIAA